MDAESRLRMFVRSMHTPLRSYPLVVQLAAALLLACFGVMTAESALHVHRMHVPTAVQVDEQHAHDDAQDCELCKVTLATALRGHTVDVAHHVGVRRLMLPVPTAAPVLRVTLPSGPSRAPPSQPASR